MPIPLIPGAAEFRTKFTVLPLATYQAGEIVLAAGARTGRLLILEEGAVAVVKDGVDIATVTERGAIFGELSAVLDQPHTADVRALKASRFHIADAASEFMQDPVVLRYFAAVLALRLEAANRAFIELKRQVQAGAPSSVIGKTVEKIESLLAATSASLVYAGYPTDPFADDVLRS